MSWVTIAAYRNRFGTTLCIEQPDGKGNGTRVVGAKMDGTNSKVASFTVDAEELIEAIESERREGDA